MSCVPFQHPEMVAEREKKQINIFFISFARYKINIHKECINSMSLLCMKSICTRFPHSTSLSTALAPSPPHPSLSLHHSLTHSLTHALMRTLSLNTHTHTHTLTHTPIDAHTHTPTNTLSLTHTHTHTHRMGSLHSFVPFSRHFPS